MRVAGEEGGVIHRRRSVFELPVAGCRLPVSSSPHRSRDSVARLSRQPATGNGQLVSRNSQLATRYYSSTAIDAYAAMNHVDIAAENADMRMELTRLIGMVTM